jgi:CheY-like chemotaxis protein
MGGRIEVQSEPDSGSVFRVQLPLQAGTSAAREPSSLGVAALHGRRALVVDDNRTNAAVLEEHLQRWGMSVQIASDGAQALEMLEAAWRRSEPVDIALIDMKMPVMDGVDLAEAMRRNAHLAATRTVLLTSLATDRDSRRAREAGVQVYVAKPVRQHELLRAILQVAEPAVLPPQQDASLNSHVLVVEDNAVNLEVLKAMLESSGCSVAVAHSGAQALQSLAAERCDLVFMDCQMPEMDGFEAVARFRAGEGAGLANPSDLPIVALTANALVGDEDRCLAAGFTDYLSKPFTRRQIEAMVKKWAVRQAVEAA